MGLISFPKNRIFSVLVPSDRFTRAMLLLYPYFLSAFTSSHRVRTSCLPFVKWVMD